MSCVRLFVIFTFVLVSVLCDKIDGGIAPRIPLSDGNSIPALGLGTFLGFDENGQKKVKPSEVEIPVTWALQAGYRLIDTAAAYHNEEQVGQAMLKAPINREDIFVVTKLGSTEQRRVVDALKDSLSRLNLTYVDLYLIHNPVAFKPDHSGFDVIDYVDTWRSMEQAKSLGLAKSIGISNFNISQIERLLANCHERPSVLQVEVNLNLAQPELLDFCHQHNITVMAYTPFGSVFGGHTDAPEPRANHPTLVEIAERYNKTVPQIVLRYLIQLNVIPIPKSTHQDRIEQNINVFDFNLSSEDMQLLRKFNKNYRSVNPSFWQDHPYYPFERKAVPDMDLFKGRK